jgi:50S ribosomal protein L16 3-hydroxylase
MNDKSTSAKQAVPMVSLGQISIADFLRHYWQKQPLLVRQAFPKGSMFAPLTDEEILTLATYDEAESRLVTKSGKDWTLSHGPFGSKHINTLKKSAQSAGDTWTVLIQDTQHFSHEAHELLAKFSFLPYSRIDDLMVSYANKGGGVGPHFDSYDVFLLQGSGQRRWQISSQQDQTLVEGAPLKILKRFKAEQDWLLEEGDMLYLPPSFAHNGVAETDGCVTWSIGFRAPSYQELLDAYLDHLRDSLTVDGRYTDAGRKRATSPAYLEPSLGRPLVKRLQSILDPSMTAQALGEFIGCYLTQPKSHVEFVRPERSMSPTTFRQRAMKHGLRLDLRARMLFDGSRMYLNGRPMCFSTPLTSSQHAQMEQLANTRQLPAGNLQSGLLQHLYPHWKSGEIEISNEK